MYLFIYLGNIFYLSLREIVSVFHVAYFRYKTDHYLQTLIDRALINSGNNIWLSNNIRYKSVAMVPPSLYGIL